MENNEEKDMTECKQQQAACVASIPTCNFTKEEAESKEIEEIQTLFSCMLKPMFLWLFLRDISDKNLVRILYDRTCYSAKKSNYTRRRYFEIYACYYFHNFFVALQINIYAFQASYNQQKYTL